MSKTGILLKVGGASLYLTSEEFVGVKCSVFRAAVKVDGLDSQASESAYGCQKMGCHLTEGRNSNLCKEIPTRYSQAYLHAQPGFWIPAPWEEMNFSGVAMGFSDGLVWACLVPHTEITACWSSGETFAFSAGLPSSPMMVRSTRSTSGSFWMFSLLP